MLILASKSPRRIELLGCITDIPFVTIDSKIDESSVVYDSPLDAPLAIARAKMKAVMPSHPLDTIITCDTVVIYENEILGKPHDESEAYEMLTKLGGQLHTVLTGLVIAHKNEIVVSKTIKTELSFKVMSDETIKSYIASGSPMDKAGSYGIQDDEYIVLESINGSFTNVMGFPHEVVKQELTKLIDQYKTL